MKLSEGLQTAIEQMVHELNANLPEDSEPQTADNCIANTLKLVLADYHSNKIRKEKESELRQSRRVVQDTEQNIQNLIVAKRKEIFEL